MGYPSHIPLRLWKGLILVRPLYQRRFTEQNGHTGECHIWKSKDITFSHDSNRERGKPVPPRLLNKEKEVGFNKNSINFKYIYL